jgi:hypothetical protein
VKLSKKKSYFLLILLQFQLVNCGSTSMITLEVIKMYSITHSPALLLSLSRLHTAQNILGAYTHKILWFAIKWKNKKCTYTAPHAIAWNVAIVYEQQKSVGIREWVSEKERGVEEDRESKTCKKVRCLRCYRIISIRCNILFYLLNLHRSWHKMHKIVPSRTLNTTISTVNAIER